MCRAMSTLCNRYLDIQIFIEKLIDSLKYWLKLFSANIFIFSFVNYLFQRIYSDIHSSQEYIFVKDWYLNNEEENNYIFGEYKRGIFE